MLPWLSTAGWLGSREPRGADEETARWREVMSEAETMRVCRKGEGLAARAAICSERRCWRALMWLCSEGCV